VLTACTTVPPPPDGIAAPTYFDFTLATTWDATKLNDTNFRVRVQHVQQGGAGTNYYDWFPSRVTYTAPDTTAPVVGTVTPANVATATLVDGTFDVSANINEANTLSSCEYCASNTTPCATWAAGVVGGSAPNWTCTKTGVTGFANASTVYLNIRGTDNSSNVGTGAEVSRVVDSVAPVLGTTIPVNGATGVTLNSTVTINFTDTNFDCSTVTTSTVTISPAVTWNLTSCTGNQAVFTPAGQANSTLYTVTVGAGTGVKDLVGNTMTSTPFSYTTVAPAGPTLSAPTETGYTDYKNPDSGSATTDIRFKVIYQSSNAPAYVRVCIGDNDDTTSYPCYGMTVDTAAVDPALRDGF
ncbi:MAG: Ig-like domain-containing protein, partial [Polynucleobacter sp.]|nr:Ig-like domain-containing protein [Polynucleobacter sp.]